MSTTTNIRQERVLSTLNADGTRRWIRPRVSPGRFLTRRRTVAYLLIAIFTLLPYLKMSGKPVILLDILHRRFTLFGTTFLPTDTLPLALLVVGIFLSVFLVTALFGRIWCGWGCPQTVYMEFVYRPIERLLDGAPGRPRKQGVWRRPLKYALYLLVSMFLAHTFLAYFVGVEQLATWVRGSPTRHPVAFLVMAATTGLMLFDFGTFREQVCIVACPYGRFQSVMLDRHSLIIGYDRRRGEPRGRKRRAAPPANGDLPLPIAETPAQGDCVDCFKCVTTCPTGIDIRDGLQMECVGCAQCIDACDDVMGRIGRPAGLIRYGSQAGIDGERVRLLRVRTVLYPLLMLMVFGALVAVLATRAPADVTLVRAPGAPFTPLADGRIGNQVRVKIVNRTEEARRYTVTPDDPAMVAVLSDELPVTLEPGAVRMLTVVLAVRPEAFQGDDRDVWLTIADDDSFSRRKRFTAIGPVRPGGGP